MYSVALEPEEAEVGTYLVIMAGQGAVARLRPVEEARRMSTERSGGMGADGARRGRADGAW